MSITQEARSRIIKNITNTRRMILECVAKGNSADALSAGDYALLMLGAAVTNIAEVMLESQEVQVISTVPSGDVPIVGRGN